MLESKIQSKILKYLNSQPNTFAYKHPPYPKGIPDIICLMQDKPVMFFEVKRDLKSKPTKIQLYRQQQIRKTGHLSYVVRSLKEVKEIVKSTKLNNI